MTSPDQERSSVVRVAFYYHQDRPLPPDHEGSNPYGALLTEALERQGVRVEYTRDYSPEYLRRNSGRIQVLHFHWPHHDYFHPERYIMEERMRGMVASLELARELGYKIVWTAHNIYPHNRLHRSIDHEFRLEICRLADAIIAHCPVNAQGLKECFGRSRRVFIIPHGHFIDVYRTDFSRRRARRELEVPQDVFAYGFIGGILPYKGIEELICAFERLSTQHSWLLLAGGGPGDYPERIRRRIAGRPRIASRIVDGDMQATNRDLLLFLEASDVAVLPFRATMTSGSVILALSRARPVIVPALGCLPTVVSPHAGLLYDPGQKESLLTAMEEIRGWGRQATSAAALESVRRFDWDRIAELTLEAYRA